MVGFEVAWAILFYRNHVIHQLLNQREIPTETQARAQKLPLKIKFFADLEKKISISGGIGALINVMLLFEQLPVHSYGWDLSKVSYSPNKTESF